MDLVHEDTKTPVHDLVDRLWVQVLKHGRGVGYVSKEDRDELAFTLDGGAVGENLVC